MALATASYRTVLHYIPPHRTMFTIKKICEVVFSHRLISILLCVIYGAATYIIESEKKVISGS